MDLMDQSLLNEGLEARKQVRSVHMKQVFSINIWEAGWLAGL